MAPSAYARKTSLPGAIVAVAILAATAALGWFWLHRSENNPMSEDAVLSANVVNMAATVPGQVAVIGVAENQRVAKGDLLFALDPEPYRLIVEQAQADLALAEATRDAQRRTIVAEQANAAVAERQVARARTNLALAEATLARLLPLAPQAYVTAQQVDDARTARDDAATSLDQALRQAEAAAALVSTLDASEALVAARQAALAIARHDLAATEVRAPHDGLVVGLTVSTGEIVAPGQSLFTLIDTGAWFASATFPETELARIAPGDCARVYVLADRSRPVTGRVEGVGWGVVSEDLLNLPRGVPYVPKSLNWVRIVQRFPVRIRLADPPAELMRTGASAVAVVRHGRDC